MATEPKGRAVLDDGRTLDYLNPPVGEGATKEVHLTADRSEVICLFKDGDPGRDAERRDRLHSIMSGIYNPTVAPPGAGASASAEAAYFRATYRWPTAVVTSPRPGFVAPAVAREFIFHAGPQFLRGMPKAMARFLLPMNRRLLAEQAPKALGDLRGELLACQALARGVMRLNQAGLAHGDLSPTNVLVDPPSGRVCLIDMDGLVVPGRFAATVLGTKGYIPPEVVARPGPGGPGMLNAVHADQHALAVLAYQFLLNRHPLDGRRVAAADTAEEQEHLAYGRDALYCEHPDDGRNRPEGDNYVPSAALGPDLAGLFRRAFVDGMLAPTPVNMGMFSNVTTLVV